MNRRDTLTGMLALGVAPLAAFAQSEKVYRVGVVFYTTPAGDLTGSEPAHPPLRNLLQELRKLGYVEGKNLVLDRVSAEGHNERYSEIIADMLRRKPDVLIASGSELGLALKRATSTVPIVMASVSQPVKNGLVASLARPGGNITGLAIDVTPEIEAKRLGLLKELVPKLSRVSCLATKWIWEGPIGQAARQGAQKLGIELLYAELKPTELRSTFANVARQRPNGLLVALDPSAYSQSRQIVEFALQSRIPGTFPFSEMALAGGLMSYGADIPDLFRRSAVYVDKILKSAKPADLPVEQPTKFEFVFNLKTAKALGLAVPQTFLLRADRVIE